MTAEELATNIGIKQSGEYINGIYTINLDNSDNYSKVYTLLDKTELADLDIDNISLTEKETTMVYLADDYDITLKADFDDNVYTVEFKEV